MNILVTGASGFIGNYLTNYLEEQGHLVKGISRNSSEKLMKLPCYEDINSWCDLLKDVNVIVHCAGRAHILNDSTTDPLKEFREVNVENTLSLAKLAIEANVKRFVFFSSLGVLGAATYKIPLDEKSPFEPAYDYAVSKVEAEQALKKVFEGTSVELVIIRPPLVYAEHAPGNFSRLIKLAKSGILLPFNGVKNRRSLISLDNLIEFTELCCTHKNAANEAFVVCDDEIVTTSEIIENLRVGMNKNEMTFYFPDGLLKFLFKVIGKIGLYHKVFGSLEVSNKKAKKLLGWSPRESSYDGLKKAGEKYKNERS